MRLTPRSSPARPSPGSTGTAAWKRGRGPRICSSYKTALPTRSPSAVTRWWSTACASVAVLEHEPSWPQRWMRHGLRNSAGGPVKVQWSRSDEFRAGFHRPPSSHRIRLSADAAGRITSWHHAFRSGHIIFTSAAMGPGLQFATSFVADPGVARGSVPPYAADATRVEFEDVRLPVRTGPWRGLGAAANHWAAETAVDALARAKGIDALDMRLKSIKGE